jgi:hypothetical protein
MLVSSAEGVKLRWDAPVVGEPSGYTMYRYTVVNGVCGAPITPSFELYGVAPIGIAPTFTDSTPVIGANYYHVTAYNSEGESLPSNQVCFQRQAQKTSAPQNLRIEP